MYQITEDNFKVKFQINLLNVPNNIETKSEKKLTSIFVIKLAAKNIATFLTVRSEKNIV